MIPATTARLRALLDRVARAAARAGRDASEIDLVAVTKYATLYETRAIAEALVAEGREPLLGESRVQALAQKTAELGANRPAPRFELIGSLQRNKARLALRHAERIQSLDRVEIVELVARLARETRTRLRVLLQVNVSGEGQKHGFAAERVADAIALAAGEESLVLEGLMGMAARGASEAEARASFARLRELRERHASLAPSGLPVLSMGMSGDFEAAILEGSNLLRIGSALFADEDGRWRD